MKFSVIVPIYNVEQYLPFCIESVLNQSFKDFELILVNDGSTDNSLSVCKKYADKDSRIVVVDQENKWLSGARNSGIKLAKGDYLIFIDGDDAIKQDALFKINQKTNECNFIGYYYTHINENNDYIGADFIKPVSNIDEYKRDFLSSDFFGSAWIKCVHKSFFNGEVANILFDENTRYAEDQIYTCDLLKKVKNIEIINEALYLYRQRAGSIMKTYNPNKIKHVEYFLDYINENLVIENINNKLRAKLFNKRIINSCSTELISICKLDACKKEKLQAFKTLTKNKYFKLGKFDKSNAKLSLIYLLGKMKIFGILMFIYKITKG